MDWVLEFAYRVSIGEFALIVALIAVAISVIGVLLVIYTIPLQTRMVWNEALLGICASIGPLFAIVAGFIALYCLQNYAEAARSVQAEAIAADNLYRGARFLDQSTGSSIQQDIGQYIQTVVKIEWPEMKHGQPISLDGEQVLDHIEKTLEEFTVTNTKQQMVLPVLLNNLNDLYNRRADRREAAGASVESEFWAILLLAGILTLGMAFLLGMKMPWHLITTCALAFVIATVLAMIVEADRPFQGEFAVTHAAFDRVYDRFST